MKKTQGTKIAINAISATVQVVFVGLSYFFLYKYLIVKLGIAQLGVWSLILSTSSIATLANFGITSGLVKFVADYRAKNKADEIAGLIFTAFVSVATFYAALSIVIYLFASFILSYIINREHIALALRLLPFSLLSLFINEIGGVFTSVFEGYQKNYIRNIIYICSTVFFLAAVVLMVPSIGLIGVAYAQVVQATLVMLGALLMGAKVCGGVKLNSLKWNKPIFKNLIAYGSKFQVISIFQMTYEPITKALLSKLGGLAFVGFYEMASRLVNQVRALIVNANQVMIPVVAQAAHTGSHQVKTLYTKSLSIILLVSSILICATISAGGIASILWIGHYEPLFVFALNALATAAFFNILCSPAYFGALGEGKLNLLLITHFTMALLNLGLGYILGLGLQGNGVIAAWCFTLAAGSIIIILIYQKSLMIDVIDMFNKSDIALLIAALIVMFINLLMSAVGKSAEKTLPKLALENSIIFVVILLPAVFYNKNLKSLIVNIKI